MLNILAVGLGGFVGAVCRYLISLIPMRHCVGEWEWNERIQFIWLPS